MDDFHRIRILVGERDILNSLTLSFTLLSLFAIIGKTQGLEARLYQWT